MSLSEDTRRKIGEANRARPKEVRDKFIYSNIGREPWNKGKRCLQLSGPRHWNWGGKMPQESIEKMRKSMTGRKQSPEHVQKRVDSRKGYTHSEETRKKISETNRALFANGLRDRQAGENSPCWDSKEVLCTSCGKLLYRSKLQLKSGKQYCSRTCFNKKNGGPINTFCSNPECKTPVRRSAGHRLCSKQFFCSPKCRAIVLNQGETHPRWLGGRSFEPYPPAWTFRLREMIRERDGRECLMCGAPERGQRHDVHHQDFDKKNLDPENLKTLCHPCHRKTYGKKYEQGWRKIFRPEQNAA
jgi:5-methylcytosine-specific restriction endonuclease McrA